MPKGVYERKIGINCGSRPTNKPRKPRDMPYSLERKHNRIFIHEELAYIIPTNSDELILIDADMVPLLSRYTWHVSAKRYARCKILHNNVGLHNIVILNTEDKLLCDHINGNTFDNRRVNLRLISIADNNRNAPCRAKSGEKHILRDRSSFKVAINIDGKMISFGYFKTVEEAAVRRDEVVAELGLPIPYCGFTSEKNKIRQL